MYVFFFQAEDGIRDLVRSRGLGDVYKRQHHDVDQRQHDEHDDRLVERRDGRVAAVADARDEPVSYTHLTLPTSDLV